MYRGIINHGRLVCIQKAFRYDAIKNSLFKTFDSL